MPKFFDSVRAEDLIVPRKDVSLFSDYRPDFSALSVPGAVAEAEELLGTPVPALPATLYMEFYRNGNRSRYEGPYFARRNAALTLLAAELTERKGRFTDLLTNYVWAICEESTWVLPAHNAPCHGNPINCLPDSFDLSPDDDMRHIDLFSAATGASLAWIVYLGGELLDGVTPVIRRRILSLLEKRIFHPYHDVYGENNWWMGENGESLNNWTPWIVSNVLTAVMLCEEDDARRAHALARSLEFLDRFTADYPSDGGCDEGPGYWSVAGASYFDCLEILRDMTGGALDLTGDPFVRRMCEYIVDFRLSRGSWANFADASRLAAPSPTLCARMGRLTGSAKLTAYAAERADPASFNRWAPGQTTYRAVRNLFEPLPEMTEMKTEPAETILYPDLGVMITKNARCGMSLAAKGGHNAESHNHNDTGSFILYAGEIPVFLDAGVEQYTKDTFSSKRYTLWAMRSTYHNLPAFRPAGGDWIEQKPGKQYAAQILSCENGFLTTELKNAYPDEAGIRSFRRRVGLDDTGFVCEDRIETEAECEIRFTLLCRGKWVPEGDGAYRYGAENVRIRVEPALAFADESVPLEAKLRREWGTDSLVRVLLTSGPAKEGAFVLRAEKEEG